MDGYYARAAHVGAAHGTGHLCMRHPQGWEPDLHRDSVHVPSQQASPGVLLETALVPIWGAVDLTGSQRTVPTAPSISLHLISVRVCVISVYGASSPKTTATPPQGTWTAQLQN